MTIAALETLLRTIRRAGAIMLDMEMFDRYGRAMASPEEVRQRDTDAARAIEDHRLATAELSALVERTRREAPEVLAAWADAHAALLTAFLAHATDATALHVARQELGQWAEVRAGTRGFVEENVYYIAIDRERYRALFGIEP